MVKVTLFEMKLKLCYDDKRINASATVNEGLRNGSVMTLKDAMVTSKHFIVNWLGKLIQELWKNLFNKAAGDGL